MQRTRRPVPGLVAVSLSRNCDVSEELSGAGGGSTLFIPDPNSNRPRAPFRLRSVANGYTTGAALPLRTCDQSDVITPVWM